MKHGRKIAVPHELKSGQRVKFKAGPPDEGKEAGKGENISWVFMLIPLYLHALSSCSCYVCKMTSI